MKFLEHPKKVHLIWKVPGSNILKHINLLFYAYESIQMCKYMKNKSEEAEIQTSGF